MFALHTLARALDRGPTRKLLAWGASGAMALRGDARRFSVDTAGRWVNRQPEATFVSPDIFTSFVSQVEAKALDAWCHDYTPAQGDVVVDLGAGFGNEVVVFSRLVGASGRVIAVEAHPGTFACLQETVRRSGCGNVSAAHYAIGESDGTLRIADDAAHVANSVMTEGPSIEVPARSLDSLAAELAIDRIDLLKINIEGAERDVMKGMAGIAPRTRHIVIECHDFVAESGGSDWFRTKAEVTAALEGFGFTVRGRPDAAQAYLRDTITASRAGS